MINRDVNHRLLRSTAIVSLATLLSRIAGLVRDAVILGLWGREINDAFLAAYRVPNFFKRLFAEGTLSSAFVPVFTDTLKREGEEEAQALSAAVFRSLALTLGIVCLLAILFAPQLMGLLVSGFSANEPDKFQMAEELVRRMMPFLWFVGLGAIAMAMLNSLDRFFIPAASPAVLNLVIIASALLAILLSKGSEALPDIRWVALGVSAGGLLQLLCQLPPLWRKGYLHRVWGPLFHPKLGLTLALALPAILGLAVTQINILISTWFASFHPGYVTYLYAANRIIQFPLGILGFAIATAALPRLSGDALHAESGAFVGTLSYSLRKTLFIMLPASAGIAFIATDAVSLAFNRGEFLAESSLNPTVLSVWAYSIGLPAFALQKVVVSGFYAYKDMKTPLYAGVAAVAINILLAAILIKPLGVFGLAAATSLAAVFNVGLLLLLMQNRLGTGWMISVWKTLLRAAAASLGMAFACGIILLFWSIEGTSNGMRFLRLILIAVAGAAAYGILSRFLLRDEYDDVLASFLSGRRAPDDTLGD